MDIDSLKKDVIDRCLLKEMINTKSQLQSQLEAKVELKEVQQVLNECQADLADQLADFKQKVQDKIIAQEISLTRVIERKADHKDLKQIQEEKVSKHEMGANYARRDEFENIKAICEQALTSASGGLTRD